MPKKRLPIDAQPGSLMNRTMALLADKDLFAVYAETRIPYYWLKAFAAHKYKNPSVNRVQALYEHLSGNSLKI